MMLEQCFECPEFAAVFKDDDKHQAWATEMLADCKFVWAVIDDVSLLHHLLNRSQSTASQDERTGLMRAPFILQVFATHLNSIVGAEDVPALEATGTNGEELMNSIGGTHRAGVKSVEHEWIYQQRSE
jgi:hypothetical protein